MKAVDDELDMAPRFWRREIKDEGLNRPKAQSGQREIPVRALRWYPPLLTLSTLMSGVFCWLYVTKPVQVTQTVIESTQAGAELPALVREAPPATGNFVLSQDTAPAQSLSFTPEQGGLPGEGVSATGLESNLVPGQDVAPVVVQRGKSSLFKPMTSPEIEEVLAASTDPVAAEIEVEEAANGQELDLLIVDEENPGRTELESQEDAGKVQAETETDEGEGNSSQPGEGDGAELYHEVGSVASVASEHRIAISLMGELVSDYVEEEAALADSKKE